MNMRMTGKTDMYAAKADAVTALAQARADCAEHMAKQTFGILDIKLMNDLAGDYRDEIKALVARLRGLNAETANVISLPARRAAILLRREISDLWMLYRMARADARKLTVEYLRRIAEKAL